MNKYKKIGLTALAGSLVATSAFAGELGVSGSASMNVEHTNGGAANSGKTFSMGNSVKFSGSGELDNGMTVSLSFELDQGDDSTTSAAQLYSGGPFDGHSVSISSDTLGKLTLSGEGGKSSTALYDTSAAGDLWDNYDAEDGIEPEETGTADNMLLYTLPSFVDGLSLNASYEPTKGGVASATQFGASYSGIDGLTVSYATGDDSDAQSDPSTGTVLKASYAYGPVTLAYSDYEYDKTGNTGSIDMNGYKVTYTVTDELSLAYASEDLDEVGKAETASYDEVSVSYTTGGMTLSASMGEADNRDGTTTATMDNERWYLGASFAF
jgi:outer membrane protein OmpU